MSKITGPLFSVSASGTIAKLLTFRATRHGSVAQLPAIPRMSASTPQANERMRARNASAAWASLDSTSRAQWHTIASNRGNSDFFTFFSEYAVQRIKPPNLPLIPFK